MIHDARKSRQAADVDKLKELAQHYPNHSRTHIVLHEGCAGRRGAGERFRRPDHVHFRVATHLSSVRTLAAFAALLVLAIFAPATLRAQDPDIIRGRVTGPDSLPIEGASVSVTAIASGVNKTAG